MTFRSLIIIFGLFGRFVSCLHIVAIIRVAQVLDCHLRMMHRAIMALVVQFAAVARLWHLVVFHTLIHLAPGLMEPVAQRIAACHIAGECQAGQHDTVPIDGKA